MTQTPENQQQYGSILTILGENAEQNGKLQNKQITFTHMAIGDANDEYVQPDRKQSALVNELARIPVNSVDVLQPTPDSVPMLKVEAILPDDVNDLVIREFAAVATFDGNTYFHAVGNNARIYVPPPVNNGNVSTPVTLEMIFVITSADPIVEMDPNVVTASREYVNKKVVESSEEMTGLTVYPPNGENAKIGDTLPKGAESIRINGRRFVLSKPVSGVIESWDLNAPFSAVIGGEFVYLLLYQWYRYGVSNIRAFGAMPDAYISTVSTLAQAVGTEYEDIVNPDATDNYSIIEAAKTLKLKLEIPSGYFLVSQGVTSEHDIDSEGWIVLSDKASVDDIGWTIAKTAWPRKTVVNRLQVKSHTNQISSKKIGIKVLDPIAKLNNCHADFFHYGIAVATYGVYLDNCVANRNGTNLTMYKGGPIDEINDIKVIGGDFTGAQDYSMVVGDDRLYPDDGSGNPHGVQIDIKGTAFDGAPAWVKNVFAIKLDTIYSEGASGGVSLLIGDDDSSIYTRNVIIDNSYFAKADIAIDVANKVDGLDVRPCYYQAIKKVKLHTKSSSFPIKFDPGASVGFSGIDWHTGVNWLTTSEISFQSFTNLRDGLVNGVQLLDAGNNRTTSYVSSSIKIVSGGLWISSHPGGRVYDNPHYAVGTMSGSTFTFNNPDEAIHFNGGDLLTESRFIRSVDYVNGTADVSFTFEGAFTLQQVKVDWRKEIYSWQKPTTSEGYGKGDLVKNNFSTETGNVLGWLLDNNGVWRDVIFADGYSGDVTLDNKTLSIRDGLIKSIS
ncbi:TPA: phage tail protein [Vibrio parahaemolyticus]|nr:phage tail protein [Vibrio parahaemolyticus]